MPLDFNGPASIVLDAYNRSVALAETAKSQMSGFTSALNNHIHSPPTISVQWAAIAPPSVPDIPNMPSTPSLSFNEPAVPGAFTDVLDADDIVIDEFAEQLPTLNFGPAPSLSIGSAPPVPGVRDVPVPDAPTVVLPDVPTFLSISTPTFGGVNLHEDWLDKLDDIPELQLMQPEPMNYQKGAAYTSGFLTNMQALLNERLRGGTGLDAAVEQALWDRARDRETQIALAGEAEIMRSAEAAGFPLPAGTLAAQVTDARRAYHDKLSGLSRDIAIKQAELEQENLKQTITMGIQLESQLMDHAIKLEQLAFEAAKAVADNAVQVYNAGVEYYRTLLSAYQTYAAAYKTVIDAELTKVEVYKAQLQGEQTKAEINTALVQQYKAQIEGSMAQVEIYKAQVSAAQTLVQLEQSKVQAAGEQIRAFVATVNAEVSKVEAYKASVGAEGTKVEAFKSLAQAFAAKAGVQAEKARVGIARYSALTQANAAQWDGYRARVAAESARVDALARHSGVVVDGYKIAATATTAKAELAARMWEASVKQYEGAQNVMLQSAKINMDAVVYANNARLDAAKVGAQIFAQQVASAYNIVNTSASISGSASMSQVAQV